MYESNVVLVEIEARVAVVTMHRPESRNALNQQMRTDLPTIVRELDASDEVSAIVLTGSDPAFCAGLDLKEIATEGIGGSGVTGLPLGGLTMPVIGAVNGPAVTGGLEIALGCDFLIASEHARFADTHARVGQMPGWGLTVKLPQAIGIRRAHQMSFTGNYVHAEQALEWGLVNEVVPHADLLPRAKALAADIATIAPANLAAIKAAYQQAWAPVDGPTLAAESDFCSNWSFDKDALAANREAIQARGRASATPQPPAT